VVEEAISESLRRRIEEDHEALDRLAGDGRSSRRSDAAEARIAAGMVLQALRYQFPAMREVSDEQLRRRAIAAQKRR
jgi:hypothetical protein